MQIILVRKPTVPSTPGELRTRLQGGPPAVLDIVNGRLAPRPLDPILCPWTACARVTVPDDRQCIPGP